MPLSGGLYLLLALGNWQCHLPGSVCAASASGHLPRLSFQDASIRVDPSGGSPSGGPRVRRKGEASREYRQPKLVFSLAPRHHLGTNIDRSGHLPGPSTRRRIVRPWHRLHPTKGRCPVPHLRPCSRTCFGSRWNHLRHLWPRWCPDDIHFACRSGRSDLSIVAFRGSVSMVYPKDPRPKAHCRVPDTAFQELHQGNSPSCRGFDRTLHLSSHRVLGGPHQPSCAIGSCIPDHQRRPATRGVHSLVHISSWCGIRPGLGSDLPSLSFSVVPVTTPGPIASPVTHGTVGRTQRPPSTGLHRFAVPRQQDIPCWSRTGSVTGVHDGKQGGQQPRREDGHVPQPDCFNT